VKNGPINFVSCMYVHSLEAIIPCLMKCDYCVFANWLVYPNLLWTVFTAVWTNMNHLCTS
jgi:hypothetical protein